MNCEAEPTFSLRAEAHRSPKRSANLLQLAEMPFQMIGVGPNIHRKRNSSRMTKCSIFVCCNDYRPIWEIAEPVGCNNACTE